MCTRPRVGREQRLKVHVARETELASVIAKTLGNFGRVHGSWLGARNAWYSLALGRDPVSRFNGVMMLSRRSRRTREFEMYRSSREGVSEGVGSCTCQNGVTQTRVRGGTEIIRTPSAGARASSPCASRRMPKTVALAPRRRPRESRDTALLRRHRRDEARSVRHRRAPRDPQKQPTTKTLRRPEVRLPRPVLVREQFGGRLRALHRQSHIVVRHAVRAHQSLNFRVGHGLAAPRTFHRLELCY